MATFLQTLSPRRHTLDVVQSARRHSCALSLTPRRHTLDQVTAFTTSPTGRVFNSRFSDRFKKS